MKLTISKAESVKPEGLSDGGHVLVPCSNCNAILMDIWVTRPHEPQVWRIKANCPFCNDTSFQTEIKGGFHAGGYGKQINEDEDIPSTTVDNFDVEGDVFHFHLLKAKDGQPVYR